MWMTTYLVREHGFSPSAATPYLSAFFLVMATSRVVCAVAVRERWERLILRGALVLPLGAFAAAYLFGLKSALALTGLFGPFFPVFLARQSRRYPDRWRSVTIWTMVAMSVTIGLCNLLVGRAADLVGLRTAYLLPPLLLIAAFALLSVVLAGEESAGRR
jgi:hypothetical protein